MFDLQGGGREVETFIGGGRSYIAGRKERERGGRS
jgi:hypothetical protein